MINFDIPFEIDFNLMTVLLGIYLVAIGVAYYFIYRKHHKRNKVELDELVSMVTKFYSMVMLSTIFIALGVYCIIWANEFKDDRNEVISRVATGIIIISITIINFIFYMKKSLLDFNQAERTEIRKKIFQIGEILELIFLFIFMFMPIWRIPTFINVFENKKELIIELVRAFGLCIASVILLFALNPLEIKQRVNKFFNEKILKKADSNEVEKDKKEENKMSKKTKTIIGIVIFILIFSIVAVRISQYRVLLKISEKNEELVENSSSYYIKIKSTMPYMNLESIYELYKDGNISYNKNVSVEPSIYFETEAWYVSNSDFINSYWSEIETRDGKEIKMLTYSSRKEDYIDGYFNFNSYYAIFNLNNNIVFETGNVWKDFWSNAENKLRETIFFPVARKGEYKGEECFVVKQSSVKFYINTDNYIPIATEFYVNNKLVNVIEYEFIKENIPEKELFTLPDYREYDIVEFSNGNDIPHSELGKEAEVAISGTNLKPDEQLVENIELKKGEVLNFLNLTPNNSGIIDFEIYSLEVYNKFREHYSGLRELTEKDFENYFVSIAYKPGEKLKYLEEHSSVEEWQKNIVVSTQKSNRESLLVSIKSLKDKETIVEYVANNKKIEVDGNEARDLFESYQEEICKKYNEEFVKYTTDDLDIMTIEEFAELDYIKKEIAGKTPICWKIQFKITGPESEVPVIAYVDAMTGELIGSKSN